MNETSAPAQTTEDERRNRRASWPVRRFRLGEEPVDDLSSTTTAEERIAMMWPLAKDAFSIGPATAEVTSRAHWPVKIRRLGDAERD